MLEQAFVDAVGELGVSIGIPELRPEDDGACLLGFDGMLVTLEQDAEHRRVLLSGHVAELPENGATEAYAQLLEANMASLMAGQGASFVIDPAEERRVLLAQALPLDGLSGERLMGALGPFVDLIEAWRGRLEALPATAADQADEPPINPALFV